MSRYYSFNDFMNDVIEEADKISESRSGCGLEELYHVKVKTYEAVRRLISKDWFVFIAFVVLLAVGPIGLGLAIAGFLTTPVGLVVVAVLGAGSVATIKQMYKDRILPQTVRKIGEKYKSRWKQEEGNRTKIDGMVNEAAEELYNNAFHGMLQG